MDARTVQVNPSQPQIDNLSVSMSPDKLDRNLERVINMQQQKEHEEEFEELITSI